ncbi:MAG: DnaJ domain-containing protein [Nanoarchaeota archaeon]|nr:DnaJ domain-containing protein [Nanoarchaeota archaeon]MBU1031178.1 DnaJ domain-containing protein [Nanoarchaeota archaeon]MBU1849677.1 DnaJ domain-containing protein [Nanoarchaeota archaeon]
MNEMKDVDELSVFLDFYNSEALKKANTATEIFEAKMNMQNIMNLIENAEPITLSEAYETLGVEYGAEQKDIRNSYRQLSMKFHPDKNPGDNVSEEKFLRIVQAYKKLQI